MQRRTYLAFAASLSVAAVAGCTGDTDYADSSGNGGNGEEDIQLLEHNLVREQFSTAVRGRAENIGDSQLSYVEIRVRFYNSQGDLLDSFMDNINDVGPGQTWSFEVMYPGTDGENVADYDIAVGTSF